jgi:hypothetical protein
MADEKCPGGIYTRGRPSPTITSKTKTTIVRCHDSHANHGRHSGGNSVVGRALAVLLQGAGYDTRLIAEPTTGKPEELLQDVQLLLVAPTPATRSRERFLDEAGSVPGVAAIPVLTLSSVARRILTDQGRFVPWPCRPEDLKTEIEGALLATSHAAPQ